MVRDCASSKPASRSRSAAASVSKVLAIMGHGERFPSLAKVPGCKVCHSRGDDGQSVSPSPYGRWQKFKTKYGGILLCGILFPLLPVVLSSLL